MGAAGSISSLEPPELAQLAIDQKVSKAEMVASTIRDNDITVATLRELGDDGIRELTEKKIDQAKLLEAYRKVEFDDDGGDRDDASQWMPDGYQEHSK